MSGAGWGRLDELLYEPPTTPQQWCEQRSRSWLRVALVLGGVGAAEAGISYQAFSYALKCAGRAQCLLTNCFEVGYSVTQALSVSAMLTAVAYACTIGS